MKRVRLQFWLLIADMLAKCGMFGGAAYLWTIGRASDCVDWVEPGWDARYHEEW